MKLRIGILSLCIFLVFSMCACNTQSATETQKNDGIKSEANSVNDIQMDIMSHEELFAKYNLSVETITITKRQTNEAEKTDFVWVDLVASNEEFTFSAEYFMIYVLYNDGWLLEECDRNENEYIAKFQPDYQIALPILEENFASYEYIYTDVKTENIIEYYFSAVEKISDYLSVEYQVSVSAGFSPKGGWSVHNPKKDGGKLIWNLEGEWTYRDDKVNIYLDILDYDEEQDVLTIKYYWETDNYSVSSGEYVYYPLKDWPHSGNYDYVKVNRETASVENGFAVNNLIHTTLYISGDTRKLHANKEGCGVLFWFHDGKIPYNIWLEKT